MWTHLISFILYNDNRRSRSISGHEIKCEQIIKRGLWKDQYTRWYTETIVFDVN